MAKRRKPPKARRTEEWYSRSLRKIARHIDDIVKGFPELTTEAVAQIEDSLQKYSELITPWARSVGTSMIRQVSKRDEVEWATRSVNMSRRLRDEIQNAPTGAAQRELLADQVSLITSLPLEAAKRVHELAQEAFISGSRPSDIVDAIKASGDVSQARAETIARTEVSRTLATFTQVRAESVGSDSYIWRTSLDARVRKEHRVLEGKTFRWNDPPVSGSNGERSHPGCIYNCRCWAEVIVPDIPK